MGATCGCFKNEQEKEVTVNIEDVPVSENTNTPRKRPNWESQFAELIQLMPIQAAPIKVINLDRKAI